VKNHEKVQLGDFFGKSICCANAPTLAWSLPTSRDIARIALLQDQGLSEEGRESSGWWLTYPSEKYEFVSWDDSSQYMEKTCSKPPTS
jgi:hypothetical protein